MFDLGMDEIVLTTVVAIVAIGPKELPRALRLAGYWIGRMRRLSRAFHAGIDTMIREAEIKELEKTWSAGQDQVLAHYAELERQTKEQGASLPPALSEATSAPSMATD